MVTSTNNGFWQFDANYWFDKLQSAAIGLSHVIAGKLLLQLGGRKTQSGFVKDTISFIVH